MDPVAALHRAHRWFWTLTAVAILLVGVLSRELQTEPGPATGFAVAVTGTLLAPTVVQACRLMLAIGRAAPAGRRVRGSGRGHR
jgi:hypothetical protein